MESYLISSHYDLITPDGYIEKIRKINDETYEAEVLIEEISPAFLGFNSDISNIFFNIKSTLAQLGLDSVLKSLILRKEKKTAEVLIEIKVISEIAKKVASYLGSGVYVGKLFTKEPLRKVRDPTYLIRMLGRTDSKGNPLLFFGKKHKEDFYFEKKHGYTVAFLPINRGVIKYNESIYEFLSPLARILKQKNYPARNLLHTYQFFDKNQAPIAKKNDMLLVKTDPLFIRTVFAKVQEDFLPKGIHHTSACVLEPSTSASGDIYEFYGNSDEELTTIPLEFFTLEPHREYVFFEDRDQLQLELENSKTLFNALKTAPKPEDKLASVFIVKGKQLISLEEKDWIVRDQKKHSLPGFTQPERQELLIEKYIMNQPSYPFLKAIENRLITSQGILLSRHFPSPLMKRLLLSDSVQRKLKGIYFEYPSRSNDDYFSHEDRSFLLDLYKFAIPTFWVDKTTKKILQYIAKPQKDCGMFVPIDLTEKFSKATFFGVYGSNLIAGNFGDELEKLLLEIMKLRSLVDHPLLCKNTPLALVTGGGTGAMEVGNRVAKKLNILSCANIVDFRVAGEAAINEQLINPHIDAKMTYRLDKLVERQAEFQLDIPIFLMGGMGADFELALEMVKRKTGASLPNPVLLFGKAEYWREKITHQFKINSSTGTIKGHEWVSNCFYSIQTASDGIKILKDFFEKKLPIGSAGPIYPNGFCEKY